MNTDIRISVSFRHHRKRKRLKLLLGPGSTDYLLDLWLATAMNHPDGVLSGMDETDIALEAGWEGDPAEFCRALLECKFLERDEEGIYFLHDWEDHQPWVVKAEARSAKARNAVNAKWGTSGEADQNRKQRSERLAEARRKGTHTEAQWKEMVKFFGSRCVRCGAEGPVIRDHITPIYQGGSDGIENIQPTCKSCNSSKGREAVDYRLLAAGVRGSEMPSEWLLGATGTPAESLQNAYEAPTQITTESLQNASPFPFLSSPLLTLPTQKVKTFVAGEASDTSVLEAENSKPTSQPASEDVDDFLIEPPPVKIVDKATNPEISMTEANNPEISMTKSSAKKATATRVPYNRIAEYWNAIMGPRGKPRITELSEARKRAMKALWRDRPTADFRDIETWQALFEHCTKSEILMDGGWFTVDWLLKPANFLKVLESNYHGGRSQTWGNR